MAMFRSASILTAALEARAEFSVRLMFVKALLTHKEYDREEWKKWA
jgi:mRNA-degrading endonuclease HigB of HigAB toxin-antitoxin module